MASPVQIVAEAAGDGYLRLGFKQGDEWMTADDGSNTELTVTLQYPVQGERMRIEGEPNETVRKANLFNFGVDVANAFLKAWCS
jgi:hypothetical protein